MFELKANDLMAYWKLNHFPVPTDKWVFFGLRGCLPLNDVDHGFDKAHDVEITEVDYTHPRCTIGQWNPGNGIALFPGSTVPHRRHVVSALGTEGAGANQLLTGYYKDYRKGRHKGSAPTGHRAFRQDNQLPVRRTADDRDYDQDDRVEYTTPYDNLHAAWCMGVDSDRYASAGCQVIVGFPKCQKREGKPDCGPWLSFKANAYGIGQKSFPYVLLNGRELQRFTRNGTRTGQRLRYGSKGAVVKSAQKSFKKSGFYEGKIDGDFGKRTLFATLHFQEAEFGPSADDGIIGPQTASALGIEWPDDI